MNRDEKLARVAALTPKIIFADGQEIIYPSEPTGGTWIAANAAGAAFALVNWYAVPACAEENPVSRGAVVNAIATQTKPDAAENILRLLPLPRISPFRLIGFFPAQKKIREWRWNGKKFSALSHPWRTAVWISSGFDEPGAQRARKKVFTVALRQKSAGSLDWLRRLHRSHLPTRGGYSICMHRDDAATVSYTEIIASASRVQMNYFPHAPCAGSKLRRIKISRKRAAI